MNGTDLGKVNTENMKMESTLSALPLPLSDSSETDVFDFGGAIQRITINSTIKDTLANIRTTVNTLKNLINGNQSTTVEYKSDGLFNNGINVKVENVEATVYGGRPTIVDLSITLIQASSRG